MNNKILLPQLVSMLASESGKSKKEAEAFIKSFFGVVAESLEQHESVKIKGFGTFKVNRVEARKSVNVTSGEEVRIPSHYKVVFIPSPGMAEIVNRDFSWLEIIELSPDVTPEEMVDIDQGAEPLPIENVREDEGEHLGEEIEKEFGEIEPVEPFGPIDPDDPEPGQPIPENRFATKKDIKGLRKNIKKIDRKVDRHERRNKKRITTVLISSILVSAALITGGFFLFYGLWQDNCTIRQVKVTPLPVDTVSVEETEDLSPDSDSASEVEEEVANTRPSDETIIDTITKKRFLTTMAREYYGDYNFWPYIYMENADIMGHPDRIKPGTPVRVPKLEKYNVSPDNPKDVKEAIRLGQEIYARYRK